MDAITLLERQGIRVHFPEEQTCCGQPAYSSGFPDEARKVAALQLTLRPYHAMQCCTTCDQCLCRLQCTWR